MIRLDGVGGKQADADTGCDRSLHSRQALPDIGHSPRSPFRLDCFHSALAIDTALRKQGKRQRVNRFIYVTASNPSQLLGPSGQAASLARGALDKRKVDFASFEQPAEFSTPGTDRIKPDLRMVSNEARKQAGKPSASEVFSHAQPHDDGCAWAGDRFTCVLGQ